MLKNNTLQITSPYNGTILRGLAAIGVMMGHVTVQAPWYIRDMFPGNLWVALFFFFTGYGLTVSHAKNGTAYLQGFLKKKIVKIYLPFLVAESAYTIVKRCVSAVYEVGG